MSTRILVIDDEEGVRQIFTEILRSEGFEVREADDEPSATTAGTDFDPHVVVADWVLADGSKGPVLVRAMKARRPDLGVVFVTGFDANELDDAAEELSARVLQKPFRVDELLDAVHSVCPAAT